MFQLYHLLNTKKTPYIKRHERDRRQIFKGLLHFEWVKNVARAWESGSGQGVAEFFVARNRGMICRCVPHDGWSIRTASQAVAPVQPYTASSGLPRRGSCGLFAGGKTRGWRLWAGPGDFLRPQRAPDARPVVRGHPAVPGGRGATGVVSELWRGQTREAALGEPHSVLHQFLGLQETVWVNLGV